VLRTEFASDSGRLSVTDFMPLNASIVGAGDPHTTPSIHRLLHCEAGEVDVEIVWAPRFDYARSITRIELRGEVAVARSRFERAVLVGLPTGEGRVVGDGQAVLHARLRLQAGERLPLLMRYGAERARVDISTTLTMLDSSLGGYV
jgi:hypothetical protein